MASRASSRAPAPHCVKGVAVKGVGPCCRKGLRGRYFVVPPFSLQSPSLGNQAKWTSIGTHPSPLFPLTLLALFPDKTLDRCVVDCQMSS